MGTFATIVIFSIVLVGLDLVIGYGELLAFSHGAFFASRRLCDGRSVGTVRRAIADGGRARDCCERCACRPYRRRHPSLARILSGRRHAWLRHHCRRNAGAVRRYHRRLVRSARDGADWCCFGHPVTKDVEFYGIGVVVLIIGIVLARNIINSRFGRAVRASGNDALAAEVLGVPTSRVRLKSIRHRRRIRVGGRQPLRGVSARGHAGKL